ncbi:MAG: amidohydrolase family protein, partial [Gammaproteobacteria bacterium]|nr:amidohydrolase family protein [Gammaproteobacteria bacterium]
MGGLTVIPGIIDAHVHMVLDPSIFNPMSQIHDASDEAYAPMPERAAKMVRAGITTARDLGGGHWLELKLRDAINAGEIPGPRLLCAGQPVTSVKGHCHFWNGEADGLEEAREVIERQIEKGVDLIKIMATGGNLTKGSDPSLAQFDLQTTAAIVKEANDRGFAVAAHCHGTQGID